MHWVEGSSKREGGKGLTNLKRGSFHRETEATVLAGETL
jgi:hypothetical protein